MTMKARIRMSLARTARLIGLATGLIMSINSWAYINHEVKRGETLWGIAHKYGVSADDIIELNPAIKKGLRNGITIRIPEHSDRSDMDIVDTVPQDGSQGANEETESYGNRPDQTHENQEINYLEPTLATANQPSNNHAPFQENPMELPEARNPHGIGANCYVARFGDTFQSVEKKTGVSQTMLASLNPLVDGNHIPESEVIRLTADAPHSTMRTTLTTVDSILYNISPKDSKGSMRKEIGVAVMLPFELSQDEISRQALLATDFYKGFLLATKENKRNIDYDLKILAVDTSNEDTSLQQTMQSLADEGITVVIPPDDDRQTEEIVRFCDEHGMMVFNILNIKDDSYLTHPNVVQCNINQKMMYDKAIEGLETLYPSYQPVILNLVGGKEEKSGFTDELRNHYSKKGSNVRELTFSDMLQESTLKELAPDKKYILIPKSGSQDVFEKIIEPIAATIESDPYPERIKLFGYPDWVAFRGQAEEELHRTGAVIYSRFNFNTSDASTGEINGKFRQWFGSPQIEVFPSQGTLGYDAGNALYRMIASGWPEQSAAKGAAAHSGKQSSFRFMQNADCEGLINDALYIIEFLPGTGTYSKVI